jgi:hypothetical protein
MVSLVIALSVQEKVTFLPSKSTLTEDGSMPSSCRIPFVTESAQCWQVMPYTATEALLISGVGIVIIIGILYIAAKEISQYHATFYQI